MHLMLRMVDMATWGTQSTPERQYGIHFVELPDGWDQLDQEARDTWQGEQVETLRAELGPAARGIIAEVVDVEEEQYAAELADSLLPDASPAASEPSAEPGP